MLTKLAYILLHVFKTGNATDLGVSIIALVFMVLSLIAMSWNAAFGLLVLTYVLWSIVMRGTG